MNTIACPVCAETVETRIAQGRKSNKPFLMLVCPKDGRHFRGFINDKKLVAAVIDKAGLPQKGGTDGSTGTGTRGTGNGTVDR